MRPRWQGSAHVLTVSMLVLVSSQGCRRSRLRGGIPEGPGSTRASPAANPTATFSPAVPRASATASMPSSAKHDSLTPAVTLAAVRISAVNGNLFIRRGPHLAFNQVGVLYRGESLAASGRDILGRWVQVSLSGHPDATGWISIQTNYSNVSGNVRELPVVDTVAWPEAAYLRNCTYHEMLVRPSETVVPSLSEFPDNEVTMYPGVYSIYDLEAAGEPEVLRVDVREGTEIDILEDGDGQRRKCP